jgi:hypothetical protein
MAYKVFVEDRVNAEYSNQFIQTALVRNQLTGNSTFFDDIDYHIGIRVEFRGPGKPVNEKAG